VEKILGLLRKALENSRVLAVVEFDPELYVFSTALQALVRKAEEYVTKKKTKKASVSAREYNAFVAESLRMVECAWRISGSAYRKGDQHVGCD
jgi:hypothetical protein